ncbi:MAG: DNA-processing protein DprA [Faecousia sp.]
MNPRERGFLLLASHLGNPERKVLTMAQLRNLAGRIQGMEPPEEERPMTVTDLEALGYGPEMAGRILALLEEEELLERYLLRGRRMDCIPVTRVSEAYPMIVRQRLGLDSPGCLWVKGDPALLEAPGIALVGSRELLPENLGFAREVGRQAAVQGLVLVSGNARGADRAAQDACLEAGGRVVSIVADELERCPLHSRVTYVSEDGFDLGFSAQRALSRNRVIHALGRMVFVAQARLGRGGTWDGVSRNLRLGISSVACFRDGSDAMKELEQMGAFLVGMEDLQDLGALVQNTQNITLPGWEKNMENMEIHLL